MGIVARQSIIITIISYAGIVLGYINLIYLYPKYLELKEVGLLRAIQDGALLLAPFASFGLAPCIARFYPKYSANQSTLKQFIGLTTVMALAGFIVLLIIFFLFKSSIIAFFSDKAPEVTEYTGIVLWLTLTLVYMGLYEQFGRSQLRNVVPVFLREVGVRLLQSILVFIYVFRYINFDQFILFSALIYVLMLFILALYLRMLSPKSITFQFNSLSRTEIKELITVCLVSFVGMSSVVLIAKMDSMMVIGYLGLDAVAIYTTAYFMATVIEVPKRAITQSATAIMAHSFERNDFSEIQKIYRKTSVNQLIIGALLLIGVWANLPNIFAIMPKGDQYSAGIWVVLIVGSAKLIDMTFGPSSEIIGLSKDYWFNLVVISALAILIIISNMLLIPRYGINGAAFGTLFSLVIYNVLKFFIIQSRLKLNPFTWNTGKVLLIALFIYFLNTLLPTLENPLIDLIIRSGLITIIYSVLILAWRCSEDANRLFNLALKMFHFKS
jgi:O-antigen/teichoic acid export membrane protein